MTDDIDLSPEALRNETKRMFESSASVCSVVVDRDYLRRVHEVLAAQASPAPAVTGEREAVAKTFRVQYGNFCYAECLTAEALCAADAILAAQAPYRAAREAEIAAMVDAARQEGAEAAVQYGAEYMGELEEIVDGIRATLCGKTEGA